MVDTIEAPAQDRVDAERAAFRSELLDAGVLVDSGQTGLYQRSAAFESVVRAIEDLASRAANGQGGKKYYFPPVMPRDAFEKTDYLRSFPQLIGAIEVFRGGDAEHRRMLQVAEEDGDWSQFLELGEVALCSAACHPLYRNLTGTLPEGGVRFEVQGYCFRHEPSLDPTRMQSFRQHEFVYVGEADAAVAHRDRWLERGVGLLSSLGLDVAVEEANDPFFGRAGQMLAANQRQTALKFEIVSPVSSTTALTAITSANCHETHFGDSFDIFTSDGARAHSACIGFGLERITLALLRAHGLDPDQWPASVRDRLWP